ncbi:TPA: hypothetical protein ACIAIE_001182 [Serratia fonticola]|uniref:hypothetical protein n=1 Tax=Serratia fonticola TaxID=47917 RepID=UPI001378A61E|nr:hypothetical protein [Serratia fonticola]NBJ35029.1 hypothetical protein [Serratia fonticola]
MVADNPIGIPDTHHQTSQRSVTLDGQPATLSRYEWRDGRNAFLEGEHFSTVIATDGTLKGFANISLDLVGKPLPSRERAEQIAAEFLRKAAPDLLTSLRRASVTPHDETILLSRADRNETVQLSPNKTIKDTRKSGECFLVSFIVGVISSIPVKYSALIKSYVIYHGVAG